MNFNAEIFFIQFYFKHFYSTSRVVFLRQLQGKIMFNNVHWVKEFWVLKESHILRTFSGSMVNFWERKKNNSIHLKMIFSCLASGRGSSRNRFWSKCAISFFLAASLILRDFRILVSTPKHFAALLRILSIGQQFQHCWVFVQQSQYCQALLALISSKFSL